MGGVGGVEEERSYFGRCQNLSARQSDNCSASKAGAPWERARGWSGCWVHLPGPLPVD